MTLMRGLLDATRPQVVTPEPRPRSRSSFTPRRLMPSLPERVEEPETPIARPRTRQRLLDPEPDTWGSNFFKTLLKRQDAIPQRSRVGTDYVHVSSLKDMCVRAHFIASEEGRSLDRNPTGAHQIMWKIGRAIEQHVRAGLIAARDREGILGDWVCDCGDHIVSPIYEAVPCERCGSLPTRYREMTLIDGEAGVIGNPDLPMIVGDYVYPLEVKSMNRKDWDALASVVPDHALQALGYGRLFDVNGYNVADEVAVLYVLKDFKWGDPYKEFHVSRHEGTFPRLLDLMWADAAELRAAKLANALPPRSACQRIDQTRAKNCPCAASCFQRRAM